jgi:hypothetical protein
MARAEPRAQVRDPARAAISGDGAGSLPGRRDDRLVGCRPYLCTTVPLDQRHRHGRALRCGATWVAGALVARTVERSTVQFKDDRGIIHDRHAGRRGISVIASASPRRARSLDAPNSIRHARRVWVAKENLSTVGSATRV